MKENIQDKNIVMEVKDISLRFGGVRAIESISFDILEGEVRAIIAAVMAINDCFGC